jgi:Tfp pilus assembly protein PilN
MMQTSTVAAMPRVNLLPPEIAERAKVRKSQFFMVGTGLAAVAVVGVMYTNASAKVSDANRAKAVAAAQNVKLRGDLQSLQHVQDVRTQVDQANATVKAALSSEIQWSRFLSDLTLRIPENVWLTSLTAQESAAGTSGTAAGQSVLDPGLGTVTFDGKGFVHDDVAAWLESLAKEKGYSNPYFSISELITEGDLANGGRKLVHFSSTVNLTPDALSNRYAKGLDTR